VETLKLLLLIFHLQMTEYRNRTSPNSSQTRSTHVKSKKFGLAKLAKCYGIADMMDFSQIDDPNTDHSIDDEFSTYTTVSFGPEEVGDAEILAFWEVSPCYLPCSLPDLMPCTTEK